MLCDVNAECVMCVMVWSAVTTELVRLTTENGHLTQTKEEMKSNVDKLSQRVASMVCEPSPPSNIQIYTARHSDST